MTTPTAYQGDAILKGVTYSRQGGHCARFEIEPEGWEVLKAMDGAQFAMVLVPVANDGTPDKDAIAKAAGSSNGRTPAPDSDEDNNNDTNKYYAQWRKRVIDHLGGSCARCGSQDNLEIDHIDPSAKSYSVSANWSFSWESQLEEINKCQLLCSSCHMEKHGAVHGTISMYRHHRCRCDACKAAWSEACRKWKGRAGNDGSNPSPATKPKSRAQMAGILCNDVRFQNFLICYLRKTPDELHPTTADDAALWVRQYCDVTSRAFLDTSSYAGRRWDELYAEYKRECM